jgi:hypothetical protein
MNSTFRRQSHLLLTALALTLLAAGLVFTQQRSLLKSVQPAALVLPNPVLYPTMQETYTANGKQWIRYRFAVLNYDSYPNEMFTAAPDLPPCGTNTKSSRTWVDFYDQSGKRLYGFCALGKSSALNDIWFAQEVGTVPPSYVYIELNDRKTSTKYKSNLAETSL